MEDLSHKKQLLAVKRVQEEMKKAEENLTKMNIGWLETLMDAHCLPLHTEIAECDVQDMERKYKGRYKLANAYYSGKSIGVPLATVTLTGNDLLNNKVDRAFNVEFGRVQWGGMSTTKAAKEITFVNNGDIEFSKHKITKATSYFLNSEMNVLSDYYSFDIDYVLDDERTYCTSFKHEKYALEQKDGILKEGIKGIEINRDLESGRKVVRVLKKANKRSRSDKESLYFEAGFNKDNTLAYGVLNINTLKSNKKANGTYRLVYGNGKGVHVYFYSRKGIRYELTTDPKVLYLITLILNPLVQKDGLDDKAVVNFVSAVYTAIANATGTIEYDVEPIAIAETELVNKIKEFRDAIPIEGLLKRINVSLDRIMNQMIKKPLSPNKSGYRR